jgi:hypothetical protein
MPINDPTTATPAEIDSELDRLAREQAKAQDTLARLRSHIESLLKFGMTAEATAVRPRIAQARQTVIDCEVAARPLDAEFARRDGWTRAWTTPTGPTPPSARSTRETSSVTSRSTLPSAASTSDTPMVPVCPCLATRPSHPSPSGIDFHW